ncbi:amino acid permease [Dellaglioa algida]|uniref:APC family permease n=1 Tax=Dellaglioa carnosa TaxID=2995136 RepID=A0ABT4JN02_9LACO|nr:APC family permease [Dellaglioa carnosa]TWW12990.1 amino acid permease [Dellaglioa algida]MCZ2491729.1 APC family permease [Dellaglioa carnosa]MCZ2493220.1 APC family permease [Dellaglioa carnosa]MCZ2494871.1 APC family permease [Dellaglioa carnosa]MDK1731734.1 APC family permease [Dellaglioa carnosa]
MRRYLKRLLIGKPLKSSEEGNQQLSKFKALALLSSDALSSVAYGTEQIVTVLVGFSAMAIWYSLPIALLVLVLLASITISYRQIIHAYPKGGGAYVVSSKNLGKNAGLISGGSLLIDYMLTVAVSVSAGTEALISAVPSLYGHQVGISVVIIILVMAMNLRGLRESASFLTVPVYLFVVMIILMLLVGGYNIMTGQVPYHATAAVGTAVPGITMALLLKAFSSGSSSLTGVEAISNAVPFFKKPHAKNAAATLTIMATLLAIFFGGITFLNYWYGIVPTEKVTVLSQIAQTTFGQGILYYIFQFSTVLILVLAANTGFSAFPILAFNLAKDKFMPHLYMDKGDRLGYSNGIITLAAGSIILTFIFNGTTSLLIPLYAVGVFIPFTLSQTGMIVKWYHDRPKGWIMKAFYNFLGAFISLSILLILFRYRLSTVWPFFIIMPVMYVIFYKINDHYNKVAEQLRLTEEAEIHDFDGSTVIVLVSSVTHVTTGAINYARSIGDYVIAMHVSFDTNPEKEHETEREFKERFPGVRFVDLHSSYRSIASPVVKFTDVIAKNAAARNFTTTVLVPQFLPKKPWQNILHNQTSLRLRSVLNSRENIIVATYNYHLKK